MDGGCFLKTPAIFSPSTDTHAGPFSSLPPGRTNQSASRINMMLCPVHSQRSKFKYAHVHLYVFRSLRAELASSRSRRSSSVSTMKLRSTEEYSAQAWTVSAISMAACVSSVLVSFSSVLENDRQISTGNFILSTACGDWSNRCSALATHLQSELHTSYWNKG